MRDEVFVRSGRGVPPTPRAEMWAPKVIAALANLEVALSEAEAFSPRMATGRVTIVGTVSPTHVWSYTSYVRPILESPDFNALGPQMRSRYHVRMYCSVWLSRQRRRMSGYLILHQPLL